MCGYTRGRERERVCRCVEACLKDAVCSIKREREREKERERERDSLKGEKSKQEKVTKFCVTREGANEVGG